MNILMSSVQSLVQTIKNMQNGVSFQNSSPHLVQACFLCKILKANYHHGNLTQNILIWEPLGFTLPAFILDWNFKNVISWRFSELYVPFLCNIFPFHHLIFWFFNISNLLAWEIFPNSEGSQTQGKTLETLRDIKYFKHY